ncbi:helix-turn-helix domain-containing protein [Pelagicoccus mobilis]|uniref:Helix-turn-helix transcriptional regulator n=1 Tax=Pelagicoccus mobilis TaxID=415221 RepID=A0A934VMD3_9BACT|nr:AraC family transcriptional regulator [Pelagicoccus mobilis]MBK1878721.1 helix-turn-helix transcriptional regulator [Pelagicoccus mobilis]
MLAPSTSPRNIQLLEASEQSSLNELFEQALHAGPILFNKLTEVAIGEIKPENSSLLAIALDGETRLISSDTTIQISPSVNAALPLSSWEDIQISNTSNSRALLIRVSRTDYDLRVVADQQRDWALNLHNPQTSLALDLLEQISSIPTGDPSAALTSQAFLRALVAHVWQTWRQLSLKRKQTDSQLIALCKRRISEQILDPALSVKHLAKELHRSPSYLSRLFSIQTGKPIIAYIRELRLQRARSFLTSTMEDVSVISWKCGFSSPSYFIRTFKKAEGIPPTSYRRLFSSN